MKKQYEKEIKILENSRNLVTKTLENGEVAQVPSSGFVRYVDHMGDDSAIVQAARVSYGKGTKSTRGDRDLLRYLMRHGHSTPFEMCFVKFHIKVPLFISKQAMRHRTISWNEYSARYSLMDDEVYIPCLETMQAQSSLNKQGRGEHISDFNKEGVEWLMKTAAKYSFDIYRVLNGADDKELLEDAFDPYHEVNPLLTPDYKENPIAREISRGVLPTGTYTQFYMAGNLLNLMKFVHLRSDSHAQYEIQVMSNAIKEILIDLFPDAMEAFEDYVVQSIKLSRMEQEILLEILSMHDMDIQEFILNSKQHFMKKFGMTSREIEEFSKKLGDGK